MASLGESVVAPSGHMRVAIPAQAGTQSPVITWHLAHFDALSAREAHDLFQLRAAVFVVEQTCVFQDIDGADPQCWHLLGQDGAPSVEATGRVLVAAQL